MLSRSSACSMPTPIDRPTWDIFCNVIDNFGDIGVCWRLARQLSSERGVWVRLWVNELSAFQQICREIDPQLPIQQSRGVEVRRWDADCCIGVVPGSVVIEAFACHLPEIFVDAMAGCKPPPVWINLDYLSAEGWVVGCHALPSPHPRLPLTKYFFFPGFNEKTGGLLRERDLDERRQEFGRSPELKHRFWRQLGANPPSKESIVFSLFAYENPAIVHLLDACSTNSTPTCCLAPVTRSLRSIESFVGHGLRVGDVVQRGLLEIRIIPFVEQQEYDQLLWLCDFNLVRGEDSFVRAQWAARPMIWHIYPQDEDTHLAKLGAFLDLYCRGLPERLSTLLRQLSFNWNGRSGAQPIDAELWALWLAALPEFRRHAEKWTEQLGRQEDLCSRLMSFCRSKL